MRIFNGQRLLEYYINVNDSRHIIHSRELLEDSKVKCKAWPLKLRPQDFVLELYSGSRTVLDDPT